jgi:hypothetical protein
LSPAVVVDRTIMLPSASMGGTGSSKQIAHREPQAIGTVRER